MPNPEQMLSQLQYMNPKQAADYKNQYLAFFSQMQAHMDHFKEFMSTAEEEHKSSNKKGVDPDAGAYEIDVDQPDSFSIGIGQKAEEMFTSHKMGYHLDDEAEDDLEELYGEEEDDRFRATGGTSFNLEIIPEKEDEDTQSKSISVSQSLSKSKSQTNTQESPPTGGYSMKEERSEKVRDALKDKKKPIEPYTSKEEDAQQFLKNLHSK